MKNDMHRSLVDSEIKVLSESTPNAEQLEANWANFVSPKKSAYQNFLSSLTGVKKTCI